MPNDKPITTFPPICAPPQRNYNEMFCSLFDELVRGGESENTATILADMKVRLTRLEDSYYARG